MDDRPGKALGNARPVSVALLGLGVMGVGMARNLLAAGHRLSVYNRSVAKAERLAAEGASAAATPREAAEGAEIVVSMVADDAASRAVWSGADGALAGAARGSILVECSTLTVDWVRELAAAAKERGSELLDAPVTGSRTQAAEGTLRFLVGGSAGALERAMPVLKVMGDEVVHFGASGAGALVKLINNSLSGVEAAALAEAVGLIERSGVDPASAVGIITGGAPGSPLVKALAARMAERDYHSPHFALKLMMKDLGYAVAEAKKRGLAMKMADAAREVFAEGVREGYGELDLAAVVEPFRKERVDPSSPAIDAGAPPP
jgi:3-hydroxyisobutyrate dehydrogenase